MSSSTALFTKGHVLSYCGVSSSTDLFTKGQHSVSFSVYPMERVKLKSLEKNQLFVQILLTVKVKNIA